MSAAAGAPAFPLHESARGRREHRPRARGGGHLPRVRFPAEPALRLAERLFRPLPGTTEAGNRLLARVLGIDDRTVVYWKRHGLGPEAADRLAIALGRHPGDIWPEWWDL